MEGILSPLLSWLELHPHFAGITAFVIAFVDSIPVIGAFLPGTILLSAVGTLMGANLVPFYEPIIFAILGIIVGDVGSYWVGYYYQDNLRELSLFRRHPDWLSYGEAFFKRYGAFAIFVGRYAGPIRCLTPVSAGMLRMRPLTFHVMDILTAIIWAPTNMLPGIALGVLSLRMPEGYGVYLLLGVLVVLIVVLAFLKIRKRKTR